MFERYEIKVENGEEVLYLYMNHDYEFGALESFKQESKNLMEHINRYIKEHKINFHGVRVFLVINGILVSSLLVTSMSPNLFSDKQPSFTLHSMNILGDVVELPEETVDAVMKEEEEVPIVKEEIKEEEVKKEETKPNVTSKQEIVKNPTTSASKVPESTPNVPKEEISKPESSIEPVKDPYVTGVGRPITIIRSNGQIINLALEDYIIGVVAGEMPASFHTEALKTQAVAARTYALKKLSQNQTMSDTIKDQVYQDIDQMKQLWGRDFDTYYNKIKNAVLNTQGQAIYYQNELIDAVYFSTSNGKTEDASYVWGNAFPYLVSVSSTWDIDTREYLKTEKRTRTNVSNKLGISIDADTPITILEKNESGRVVSVKIGESVFRGIDLYNKLGLRSRDFEMWVEGDYVYFKTLGWGHGVGLSQYGANGMAKEGYTYKQILTHYYQGTSIH